MAGLTPPKPTETRSGGLLALLVLAALGAALVFLFLRAPTETSAPETEGEGGAGGGVAPAVPRERCSAPGEALRVGEVGETASDEPPIAAPFAAEVGRATVLGDGYAVGVKRFVEAGALAEVVLLGPDGRKRAVVPLGPVRGDGDAPLVVPAGDDWVAGLLEANAGGWALRLVFKRDGEVVWAAEIDQGRDESLAFDLEFGARAGVAAWDDLADKGEASVVMVAPLSLDERKLADKPKVVSRAEVDAELPRLAKRQGGFWLAYLARERSDAGEEGAGGDGRYAAEQISPAWIELLPLDEEGRAQGEPMVVTPRDGYALTYDLRTGGDGQDALIALREDDTPSGSHGGQVLLARIGPSGAAETQVVAEDDVGAGVPQLLGGWLVVPNSRAVTRLAPLDPQGRVLGELLPEPAIGRALPVAAAEGRLLLARPYGQAMELSVLSCDAKAHPLGAAAVPSAQP